MRILGGLVGVLVGVRSPMAWQYITKVWKRRHFPGMELSRGLVVG